MAFQIPSVTTLDWSEIIYSAASAGCPHMEWKIFFIIWYARLLCFHFAIKNSSARSDDQDPQACMLFVVVKKDLQTQFSNELKFSHVLEAQLLKDYLSPLIDILHVGRSCQPEIRILHGLSVLDRRMIDKEPNGETSQLQPS